VSGVVIGQYHEMLCLGFLQSEGGRWIQLLYEKTKNILPINPNLEELCGQLLVVFPNNGLQKVEPFRFHYRYLAVKVIIIGHLLQ
jgi:hypothetical protein